MRIKIWILVCAIFLIPQLLTRGQGTFRNLDFESATVPPTPAGQTGNFEPIGDALPFWNAYLGTNQLTQVLHNNFRFGAANISILGPTWSFTRMIDGAYTVLLQPSIGPQGILVDVSISQFGTIPTTAQSLQFKSDAGNHHFAVSFGNQSAAAILLSVEMTTATYGVDISQYAGLSDDLRITVLAQDAGNAFLDSIVFSDQSIPEPSSLALFILGTLLLGWRIRQSSRDK